MLLVECLSRQSVDRLNVGKKESFKLSVASWILIIPEHIVTVKLTYTYEIMITVSR